MKAEARLQHAKRTVVQDNVWKLMHAGFKIDYDNENDKLLIKNLEHLNTITAETKGEYNSIEEATNALRKEYEELIEVTEELNDDNIQSTENIENLRYEILEAKNNIVDYIEEVYDRQIESYQEIIELRKEAIEAAKDELDYETEVADKIKEIADLQARIDKLSLDDSREATAEKNTLMEELRELNKELAETQGDHAYDQQVEALEKAAEAYEKEKQDATEYLRATVTASDDIWSAFYDTLQGKTVSLAGSINKEIANAWMNAAKAVRSYGDSVAGIAGFETIMADIPIYHNGGVVGENSNKKEVLAVLEKGEIVLDDDKQDTLYDIIDIYEELGKKLGVDPNRLRQIEVGAVDYVPHVDTIPRHISEEINNYKIEPSIHIEINHNGNMTDSDAARYSERIANTTLDKLYSAFERKGITNTFNSRLKP